MRKTSFLFIKAQDRATRRVLLEALAFRDLFGRLPRCAALPACWQDPARDSLQPGLGAETADTRTEPSTDTRTTQTNACADTTNVCTESTNPCAESKNICAETTNICAATAEACAETCGEAAEEVEGLRPRHMAMLRLIVAYERAADMAEAAGATLAEDGETSAGGGAARGKRKEEKRRKESEKENAPSPRTPLPLKEKDKEKESEKKEKTAKASGISGKTGAIPQDTRPCVPDTQPSPSAMPHHAPQGIAEDIPEETEDPARGMEAEPSGKLSPAPQEAAHAAGADTAETPESAIPSGETAHAAGADTPAHAAAPTAQPALFALPAAAPAGGAAQADAADGGKPAKRKPGRKPAASTPLRLTREQLSNEILFSYRFPYMDLGHVKAMQRWVRYKQERGQAYKSEETLRTCYEHFLALCHGNYDTGLAIVNRSVANNWSGLFAPDEKHTNSRTMTYDEQREHDRACREQRAGDIVRELLDTNRPYLPGADGQPDPLDDFPFEEEF